MHLHLLTGHLTWQQVLLNYAHTLLLLLLLLISQKVFKVLVGLLLLRWTLDQRTWLTRIRWRRFRIWRRRRLLLAGNRNRTRLSRRLLKLLVKHGLTSNSHQLLLWLLRLWPRPGLIWIGNGLNDAITLNLLNDSLLLLLLLTGHHVLLNHSTRVTHLELLDSGWIDQTSPHSDGNVIVCSHNSDSSFLGQ